MTSSFLNLRLQCFDCIDVFGRDSKQRRENAPASDGASVGMVDMTSDCIFIEPEYFIKLNIQS